MPRKPASDIDFPASSGQRLQPPDHLDALERAEFVALVMSLPANHFEPSDSATVSAYVRSVIAERVADGELSACPITSDNKPSPWLPIWTGRLRAVTTLARRLRLGPAGRSPSPDAPAPEHVSAYQILAAEAGRDGRH